MKIGIVGLPNVGKSTLFNILTKSAVTAANYPFATIDPNVGIVSVPDERLKVLTDISKSEETIPAIVEFYDIAGLVKGANKGEGLGNKFLAQIREVHAIVHLVRCFTGDDVVHVEGKTDPTRDIDIIEYELILKDMESVERYLVGVEKRTRTGDKKVLKEKEVLEKMKGILMEEKTIAGSGIHSDETAVQVLKELRLLTDKPQLFLFNGQNEDVTDELKEKVKSMGFDYVITDLSSSESVPELIKKAYKILNLITFFTTGEKETRAWTVGRGVTAQKAAGVIHTDFEDNFIRVEVVPYQKLVESRSWNKSKEKGEMMLKGKEYVVQDGDVVYFRVGK